jgi:hypothetical protein
MTSDESALYFEELLMDKLKEHLTLPSHLSIAIFDIINLSVSRKNKIKTKLENINIIDLIKDGRIIAFPYKSYHTEEEILDVLNTYSVSFNRTYEYHKQSIEHHRSILKTDAQVNPIVLFKIHSHFLIIDGCHRVCASLLEKNNSIYAHVIEL